MASLAKVLTSPSVIRLTLSSRTCGCSVLRQTTRSIYSLTGKWPKHIDDETTLKEIEKFWRPKVVEAVKKSQALAKASHNRKDTKYVLSMFPYPSGSLHMGHVRVYAISDAYANYFRIMGHPVIHPMGWDAFGLPAENAAIERNVNPGDWTRQNIASMKEQLNDMACIFDWDREFATCDPEYYRWTQYLFVKMFKSGLAYQQESMVNWDPVDQTVLADEQVDDNGRSWRSGAKVEKKPLKQWFLRTTNFSKDLYDGLEDPSLENWRDIVKVQQHWIGECSGTRIEFSLDEDGDSKRKISVWTDRPELLYGVSFVGIAPDHILNKDKDDLGLRTFKSQVLDGAEVKILKECVMNPFSNQQIPICVIPESENSLFPNGANAFLANPDICETTKALTNECNIFSAPSVIHKDSQNLVNSGPLNGLDIHQAREKAMQMLKDLEIGGYWTSSKLSDWLISRQRYWGTPIPIVHCQSCGAVPVPEADLPVILPKIDSLSVKGQSPLLAAKDWLNTSCPNCGQPAKRESDTMDTFVDSSWYFGRYLDPKNDKEPFGKEASEDLPVDLYIGGKEHATLHMYYARFFTHFMHQIGLSPVKEPFKSLLVQGMVKGMSYRIKGSGQYVRPAEVDTDSKPPIHKESGKPVVTEWEKMSKSKYNGVDPGDILEEYGCDTTKLLILSDVSPQSDRKWSPKDSHVRIQNMQRKYWKLVHAAIEMQSREGVPELTKEKFEAERHKLWDARNFYVRGANNAYIHTKNLAMVQARVQGLLGELWACGGQVKRDSSEYQRGLATAIILLSPMAPHFCSELWEGLSKAVPVKNCHDFDWDRSLFQQPWPELDSNYNLKVIVQQNGEPLSEIPMAVWKFSELEQEEAFNIACCDEKVQEQILHLDFEYTFDKVVDYEAVINFKVDIPEPTEEEKRRLREEKKEAKLQKKLKREQRKADLEKRSKEKSSAN